MRPVNKCAIGQTIALEDGTNHVVQAIYDPYRTAKGPLIANLGKACSYCEVAYGYPRDLHVEHILPKNGPQAYPQLETAWDNFLLGCATCNGSDNKGTKAKLPHECHFPQLNNTFLSLKYDAGGVVTVNPALRGISRSKAECLLQLVGLDKSPDTSNNGDTRWRKRSEAWDLATRYRAKYIPGITDIDNIIDYVKASGNWSIWFTAFAGIDEVRERLISDFPGTAAQCFDPANGYNPVERNPGQVDPV